MSVKNMVLIAMLAAVAFMMAFLIRIPVVLFLSYEPKDVIITVGGFLMGPFSAFLCSLLASLAEMGISSTGPVGAIMNLLSTCAFSCTAAFIYKKKHTLGGAVLGLTAGSAIMITVMLLWNWLITPLYMGVDRQTVEALLIPAFLPFNALKAGLNTALTLALYKPLVTALRRTGLVEGSHNGAPKSKIGIYLLAGILLLTCVLFLLALKGII